MQTFQMFSISEHNISNVAVIPSVHRFLERRISRTLEKFNP